MRGLFLASVTLHVVAASLWLGSIGFVSLVLVRTRTEIRLRRLHALEALEARA